VNDRNEDTTRINRTLGLTPEDRLERIESDIREVDRKIDEVLKAMAKGDTRFNTLELTIASLTQRVQRLEDGRDAVIKTVMYAVGLALLGLLGFKAFG
jgi:septation ring formation regulator EzrA